MDGLQDTPPHKQRPKVGEREARNGTMAPLGRPFPAIWREKKIKISRLLSSRAARRGCWSVAHGGSWQLFRFFYCQSIQMSFGFLTWPPGARRMRSAGGARHSTVTATTSSHRRPRRRHPCLPCPACPVLSCLCLPTASPFCLTRRVARAYRWRTWPSSPSPSRTPVRARAVAHQERDPGLPMSIASRVCPVRARAPDSRFVDVTSPEKHPGQRPVERSLDTG